jgi:hypothetical protein
MAAGAATLRTQEAAQARSRARSLRRQLDEESTWAGVLMDLLERGRPVTVSTLARRVVRGRLSVVGRDFCGLVVGDRDILVPYAAVTTLRAVDAGAEAVAGGREPDDVMLAEALGRLAERRARATVTSLSGEVVTGEVAAVGRDTLTVLAGPDRAPLYVRLASVSEVSWRVSG